ncbi:uncharacterized protein PHACADRAFT_201747 [Phanerochaete carnosa HHB-10118-sp]|uniref:Uncharacterized protein n=1 Tax=Phanerochaete carnosa (strain HHB-10118-sp) TaxID=650164 RepID=K5VS30_PHACS|nr:uncharacterized protein PHACADRAFT_201747 [Phanerochaete carnosa HHB-10118-sp]EKM49359.1 hypothetical protein PHACADRAFT_201747 [Phanerochaete carnosa HHB-10118-sp]
MIVTYATFFCAETISSVAEFIKLTYAGRPFKPEHVYFDSNCILQQFIDWAGDLFFHDINLSVDAFHFRTKHKESDMFCQEYCNPASFPKLKAPDGKWYFNSSIAEQMNIWLANYNLMCWEMRADRHNFFLDEMIMRQNRKILTKLAKGDQAPGV